MSAPTDTGPAFTVLFASGPPVSRMIVSMGTLRMLRVPDGVRQAWQTRASEMCQSPLA